MHIVYLGVISRPEDIGKIGEASVAGNKMQYNLLKYLSQCVDVTVDVVSFHPYKPFKYSKKLLVKSAVEKLFDNVNVYQVGYFNLPIIKQLLISANTKKVAQRLLKKEDILFIYDMYPTQGNPFTKLARKVDGKAVCLLADLSIGGVCRLTGIKKILRKIYDAQTLSNIKKCKYYIALNENAMKVYAPDSQYLIMDGGVEPAEFECAYKGWDNKIKNVVYTGALVEYSGIMNLIQAISLVKNKNVVLDIYGEGPLKQKILEISKENQNVRYHGSVSNLEAIEAQRSAWLLANPRPVDNSIAKVTFPSKIFEYLMSGRPVMTTRLNGFSKDYDELLFWTEDTPEKLAKTIDYIDERTSEELLQISEKAKQYLLNNKTWEMNANRVYNFLKESFE